eukprot:GEMP01026040.1.p1 GENE.GEMP01026040.1~~GEMP01026040.1.p1  ORF type:complete len:433 (+),score=87.51 GEMP01026040.1:59-1300(+)
MTVVLQTMPSPELRGRIPEAELEALRFHEIYDAGEKRGRLAFTICPGEKRAQSGSGVCQWRNLRSDLKMCEGNGYNVVLNLLPEDEMKSLGLSFDSYATLCKDFGLEMKHHPIHVHTAPKNEVLEEICNFLQTCYEKPLNVVIHSRGGLGRASLVSACALYHLGKVPNAEQALRALHTRISTYCVERGDQEKALAQFCLSHVPTHRSGLVNISPPDLTRDSDDNPIRINWMWDRKVEGKRVSDISSSVDAPRLKGGCIGVTICPGKKQSEAFCDFKHFRSLKKDLDVLKNNGTDTLVCLLSEQELADLQVIESSISEFDRLCNMNEIHLVHRPLSMEITKEAITAIAKEVVHRVVDGDCVVIHCRGGLKRAALVAAEALKICGKAGTADEAVDMVRKRRSMHAIPESDVALLA